MGAVRLMQVLLVNPPGQNLPAGTADLMGEFGWNVTSVTSYRDAVRAAGDTRINAVVLAEPVGETNDGIEAFEDLVRVIDGRRVATVMLSDRPKPHTENDRSLIDTVDRTICLAELRGRLAMIDRFHGLVTHMERELDNMQRLGKRLNRHFVEFDQEMRLAGRLQQDFLPDISAPIENVQFASVFRPASWVSGDIYDVFRIDEDVTGFYVVDAVGHGMAASLLTMFIKRAIVSKQVSNEGYKILTPSETMATLNAALSDQSLPNCQFVTACYGLFNHRTLTLQYARGGHPYPMLITPDGVMSELKTPGGLLGIFESEEFPTFSTQLRPGDKLLIYTDGVELAFQAGNPDTNDILSYQHTLEALADQPIRELARRFEEQMDAKVGSLEPRDDVTLLGLEVLYR